MMDPELTYAFATFSDRAVHDEMVWEGLWICPTCFHIHGKWFFRRPQESLRFYQRCLCEPVERVETPPQ